MLLFGLIFLYYFWRQEPRLWLEPSVAPLLLVLLLVFLVIARVWCPPALPYLVPSGAHARGLIRCSGVGCGIIFTLLVGWRWRRGADGIALAGSRGP
jgi:hypothetical protein